MIRKRLVKRIIAGGISLLCIMNQTIYADEMMQDAYTEDVGQMMLPDETVQLPDEPVYEEEHVYTQEPEYDNYAPQNIAPAQGEFQEYHEEYHEYYEEEYYDDSDDTEDDTEYETDTEEYGEGEAHGRRKPEDGYLVRKNPEESSFEDFKILGKEDAEKDFELLSFLRIPVTAYLEVEELKQNPELPTGCESVALTMALKYEGFDMNKTLIASEFLIYNLEDDNPAIGYIGDPFSEEGAGCFAPALAATADNYFIDQGYDYEAYDITGTDFEDLLCYVAAGTPVIVWSTMYMDQPEFTGEEGVYNGQVYRWFGSEHCVVLSGYDLGKNTLQINDPLEGIVTRDMDEFKAIYDDIGQYAVVLKEKS